MEDAEERSPDRCLPLVMAKKGTCWEILSTHHVRASWDGTSTPEAPGRRKPGLEWPGLGLPLSLRPRRARLFLKFHSSLKTPDGSNLMVRGPTNSLERRIETQDGIIETDWAHSTFIRT